MNKLELRFRKDLITRMGGRWLAAIHVENHLNPGVPDLSYVMVAPGHETGWLELKASMRPAKVKTVSFKMEPSQHQWMIKYAHRVPTHILAKVGDAYYLIDGRAHVQLAEPVSEDDLKRMCVAFFNEDTLVSGLTTTLSGFTRRDRNGS